MTKLNRAISFLILFLTCSINCLSQQDRNLKEFQNRFEGSTTEQISGSANLRLVSCFSYFQNFKWHQNQKLTIRFYLEKPEDVKILVQQVRGNVIYRMKPKPFPKAMGFNEFGPWPVDDMLSKLELSQKELGITIIGKDESIHYPATIYYSKDSINFQRYLFEFLPGKNLKEIKFTLYKGFYKDKEVDIASEIYSRDFGRRTKLAGEPFELFINKNDMKVDFDWQGWITMTMKAKVYENNEKVDALFFFYHKPY